MNVVVAITVYILRAILQKKIRKNSLKDITGHPLSLQMSDVGLNFYLKPVSLWSLFYDILMNTTVLGIRNVGFRIKDKGLRIRDRNRD